MEILVIEDESKIARNIKQGLEENGYFVEVAFDGIIGLRLGLQKRFDLIVLDAILPGKNGFEICQEIRAIDTNIKIIMLTALGTTEDKIEGLEAGADDYLVKPFEFRELLARIKSLLRRSDFSQKTQILKIGDLELNLAMKCASRDNERIDLTAKEFALLELLMKNKGKILSRYEIVEKVWDLNFDPGTNVVEVYINILRKKVDKGYDTKLIHNKIGHGYYISEVS